MDPGSSAAPLSPAGSLDDLAARAKVTFPHLDQARDLAARRIADASDQLATATPDDVSVCVDFEGKNKTSGGDDPKWVMRNAKLRTSRKILFAGGLRPVLFCRLRERDEIPTFLTAQLAARPVDRLAWAFLEMNRVPEGARCLSAYDEWISMLQDAGFRAAIAALRADTRDGSGEFARVRSVGERVHSGLTALLFESPLGPESTRYLVL